ncbi:hypothetical protein [Paenibacillus sp. RUD330]|uniref:hypothetical protein n=1 Tax=Paenibacillus sp. RUD330 TaxID=2023772 RepID=UPI000B925B95|nr:hypothetical protein [Paenibacillus sp. RUD330]ASS66216.1 hypothetical protein CIC07_08690 [Paenibacillus sp. RUD330]
MPRGIPNSQNEGDEQVGLERQAADVERSMKQILDAQPKKSLEIPTDPQNPNDIIVPIGINGIVYAVPRGVEVEVPQSVYEAYKDSDRRTKIVNQRIVDGPKKELQIY